MLLLPSGATQNASAPLSTWQYTEKQKPQLATMQCTGLAGKSLWEGTVHSEKTTLIINLGNWNTLQNHCYKFNIYTKSGGWSSCYYREGKHEKLPEREAHLPPRLTKCVLILQSHFTEKETELPKDQVSWPMTCPMHFTTPTWLCPFWIEGAI